MVTAEEIGEIDVFAALDLLDRERLARVAADISLVPDEYAVHEGGERALFAVLEGRIQPIKLVDASSELSASGIPGTFSERCRSRSGPCSLSGFVRPRSRASCGSSRTTITLSQP